MKRHIVTLIAILCCHIVLAQTEQTKGSLIVKETALTNGKSSAKAPAMLIWMTMASGISNIIKMSVLL